MRCGEGFGGAGDYIHELFSVSNVAPGKPVGSNLRRVPAAAALAVGAAGICPRRRRVRFVIAEARPRGLVALASAPAAFRNVRPRGGGSNGVRHRYP